jgi:hypothetical protein
MGNKKRKSKGSPKMCLEKSKEEETGKRERERETLFFS